MILRAALALACLAARVAGQLRGPRPTTSGTPKPTGASQRKKVCDDLDEAGNPIYINFVKHEFGRAMTQAKSMLATDLDGDGDGDVLVAYISDPDSSGREGFHWYEADPSKSDGYRWREVEYGVPGASAIHAGDIDGDGDLDVVVSDVDVDVDELPRWPPALHTHLRPSEKTTRSRPTPPSSLSSRSNAAAASDGVRPKLIASVSVSVPPPVAARA